MLAAVRDQILRRADIASYAERAGFRPGRGNKFHCAFHRDEHPSCSICKHRIHCWSQCSRSWNAVDLVIAVHGFSYVDALKFLAAETGIQWPDFNSSPIYVEDDWPHALASDHWRAGVLERIDSLLTEHKSRLLEAEPPPDDLSIQQLTIFQQTLLKSSRTDLLSLYRSFQENDPEGTATAIEAGKATIEHAQLVTAEVVCILQRAQIVEVDK